MAKTVDRHIFEDNELSWCPCGSSHVAIVGTCDLEEHTYQAVCDACGNCTEEFKIEHSAMSVCSLEEPYKQAKQAWLDFVKKRTFTPAEKLAHKSELIMRSLSKLDADLVFEVIKKLCLTKLTDTHLFELCSFLEDKYGITLDGEQDEPKGLTNEQREKLVQNASNIIDVLGGNPFIPTAG